MATLSIAIRGFTDAGDATEDFNVDTNGVADWKTAVDSGSAPFGAKRYNTYGGPWLAGEGDIEALVAAGDKGIDLLPTGHATLMLGEPVQIDGPDGPKTVKLAFIRGARLLAQSLLARQRQPFLRLCGHDLAAPRRL